MLETQRLGRDLDNACAVHIADLQNDRGDFIVPVLTEDKWGDRAVVVARRPAMKAIADLPTPKPTATATATS